MQKFCDKTLVLGNINLEIYLNATYFISSRLLDITTQWMPKQVISRAYSISGIRSIKHTLRQESNDPGHKIPWLDGT